MTKKREDSVDTEGKRGVFIVYVNESIFRSASDLVLEQIPYEDIERIRSSSHPPKHGKPAFVSTSITYRKDDKKVRVRAPFVLLSQDDFRKSLFPDTRILFHQIESASRHGLRIRHPLGRFPLPPTP